MYIRNVGIQIQHYYPEDSLKKAVRWDLYHIRALAIAVNLTSTKWWAPASDSKWRMGFNNVDKMVGSCQC
jgi:hypothetical protein